MKNFKSLKGILVILILITLVLFLFYYFIFVDIKQRNEKISELQSKIEVQTKRDQYTISAKQEAQDISDNIGKIDKSVIGKDNYVDFIEQVEGMAKKNNLEVSIDSLTLDELPSLADSGMTTLVIKAKTKGSWIGVYSFVNEIESLPTILRVEKMNIMYSSDAGVDLKKSNTNISWLCTFEIRVLKYK